MEVFRVVMRRGKCACNGRELWHERSFDGSGLLAYFCARIAHARIDVRAAVATAARPNVTALD